MNKRKTKIQQKTFTLAQVRKLLTARFMKWAQGQMSWIKKLNIDEVVNVFAKKLRAGQKISHGDVTFKKHARRPRKEHLQGLVLASIHSHHRILNGQLELVH